MIPLNSLDTFSRALKPHSTTTIQIMQSTTILPIKERM